MPRLRYQPWRSLFALSGLVLAILFPRDLFASSKDSHLNRLTPREQRRGWTLLFDGLTTAGWTQRGQSDWHVVNGTLTPKPGSGGGFLCTTAEYSDFELHAEFWIDETANSGVFLRCPRSGDITTASAYEVNIYDAHPKWPTGSINDVARCRTTSRTVGRWNTYDIRAEGTHLVIRLNGRKVVDTHDPKNARGLIGLQTLDGRGTIQFRNLKLRPLPH